MKNEIRKIVSEVIRIWCCVDESCFVFILIFIILIWCLLWVIRGEYVDNVYLNLFWYGMFLIDDWLNFLSIIGVFFVE